MGSRAWERPLESGLWLVSRLLPDARPERSLPGSRGLRRRFVPGIRWRLSPKALSAPSLSPCAYALRRRPKSTASEQALTKRWHSPSTWYADTLQSKEDGAKTRSGDSRIRGIDGSNPPPFTSQSGLAEYSGPPPKNGGFRNPSRSTARASAGRLSSRPGSLRRDE